MQMEIDKFTKSEVSFQLEKSPYSRNYLHSWIQAFRKVNENSGQNVSFLQRREVKTICEQSISLTYGFGKNGRNNAHCLQLGHDNERIQEHVPALDGGNNEEDVITTDGKKNATDERRGSDKSKKRLSISEGLEKEDKKGKTQNTTQQIKSCNCQELTPEQIEQNLKPPPCTCAANKSKKVKTCHQKEKNKDCPECDRIKLNANLIRAIQRINELQAQCKLTESDVKVILEEEYHGNIFGFQDKKKTPDSIKKTAEEPPEKTISERELEMREDFKEIIENEVTKFEDRKKKKVIAPKVGTPKDSSKTDEKKKKKKKRKTKEVPLDMQDILKWMYPSRQFGHKHCIQPLRQVPKTMGWLWNCSQGAGLIKPGRGWVPGAIRRDVVEVIKKSRKDRRGIVDDEDERTIARSSQRSGTPKSKENQKGVTEQFNPTFHMHKKDGYYYFSLYPVKNDDLEKIGQDPKPTMFKISAKQPDDGSEEWSTDDDSYEIEFVTPSAMKKQIKEPLKKNASQQYIDDEVSVKSKKDNLPEPQEKGDKTDKKDKCKKNKKCKKK